MKNILFLLCVLLNVRLVAQDTITLEPYFRDLKTINMKLNNRTYKFLFDAAAAQTFISQAVADENHINGYGNSAFIRMHGEVIHYKKSDPLTLKYGTFDLVHDTPGIWDIMSILPKELPPLDGVVSLKSFQDYKIILDLSKNSIILNQENPDLTGSILPSRFASGLEGTELNIFIGIPINEKIYWFLFDSGNIGPVIFSKQAAEELNLEKNNPFKKVTLAIGKNREEAEYSIEDILYDGVLNYAVISKYRLLIDFSHEKVWLLK